LSHPIVRVSDNRHHRRHYFRGRDCCYRRTHRNHRPFRDRLNDWKNDLQNLFPGKMILCVFWCFALKKKLM
jgi:hypothetical protein